MHNGVFEGVVVPLGFGTVLVAFSRRLRLFPRQITNSGNKLLGICDRGMLVGFTSFKRIEHDTGEQAIPILLAG
jgi:hypothetical protein